MKQQQIDLIKSAADDLLKANNTVTTLEIKGELRKNYPEFYWVQRDISVIMDNFYANGYYDYFDTGTYRIYSKPTPTTSKSTTSTTTTNVVLKQSKSNQKVKISKTKALELIQNSNGKFFGVTFTKKDGTVRKMTCKLKGEGNPNSLGYLPVVDVNEQASRQVNLQTLFELRINKTNYII